MSTKEIIERLNKEHAHFISYENQTYRKFLKALELYGGYTTRVQMRSRWNPLKYILGSQKVIHIQNTKPNAKL